MSKNLQCIFLLLLIGTLAWANEPSHLSVPNGTIKFTAVTNLLGLKVEGLSNEMTASVVMTRSDSSINLEDIHARVDPNTFSTGMSLRDSHLRKKVFSLQDGTIPDLQFVSGKAICGAPPSGQDARCPVSGQLSLRGVTRPFTLDLKIRNEPKGYRVTASTDLRLSTFGIEPPCQLGVCVTDDVKLNFEFQAKEIVTVGGVH